MRQTGKAMLLLCYGFVSLMGQKKYDIIQDSWRRRGWNYFSAAFHEYVSSWHLSNLFVSIALVTRGGWTCCHRAAFFKPYTCVYVKRISSLIAHLFSFYIAYLSDTNRRNLWAETFSLASCGILSYNLGCGNRALPLGLDLGSFLFRRHISAQ